MSRDHGHPVESYGRSHHTIIRIEEKTNFEVINEVRYFMQAEVKTLSRAITGQVDDDLKRTANEKAKKQLAMAMDDKGTWVLEFFSLPS